MRPGPIGGTPCARGKHSAKSAPTALLTSDDLAEMVGCAWETSEVPGVQVKVFVGGSATQTFARTFVAQTEAIGEIRGEVARLAEAVGR
jgi:hypothetical protein